MHKEKDDGGGLHRPRDLTAFDHTPLDGEMFLQALNGFLMILTCEGEVFFATHSIEGYLGFHQSDIVHQSVFELVHSEDREELQRQLMWNSFLPPESANMGLQDVLLSENCHLLERSFTVRFRCLLDNTSGFLRLDIRGRVKVLHGQNRKTEEAPLALFAICTPFGPPSLLEIPQKEVMFKSKHKLDFALVSMDQRGKMLLGYSDSELANMGGYDLVHFDDLAYVASAHQELLKTGASGMIAYRFQTKDGQWQWLQTSSRLVYKNSKPDFVISTHRPLMEEEGRDLLGKRTMDFKVSYLDAGLPNSYFAESDHLLGGGSTSGNSIPPNPSNGNNLSHHVSSATSAAAASTTPSRVNRRYKTQLRDFLSTCRTKRKLTHNNSSSSSSTTGGHITPPSNVGHNNLHNTPAGVVVSSAVVSPMTADYITAPDAYNMYGTAYPTAAAATDHGLSYMSHTNFHHNTAGLYPTAAGALENRYLAATTENLFHQYRPLSSYYTDYHHTPATSPYVGNGFLEMPSRSYDSSANHHATYRTAVMPVDEKLYPCQQVVDTTPVPTKYPSYVDTSRSYVVAAAAAAANPAAKCLDVSGWPYSVGPSSGIIQPVQVMGGSPQIDLAATAGGHHKQCTKISKHPSLDGMSSSSHSSPPVVNAGGGGGLITPKMEDMKSDNNVMISAESPMNHEQHFSPVTSSVQEMPRQTVLMWGSNNHVHSSPNHSTTRSPIGGTTSDYNSGTTVPSVPTSEGCEALKSLTEISNNHHNHNHHHQQQQQQQDNNMSCKWQGSGGDESGKNEPTPTSLVGGHQNNNNNNNSDSESPHNTNNNNNAAHHNHSHNNNNSRVVMVL